MSLPTSRIPLSAPPSCDQGFWYQYANIFKLLRDLREETGDEWPLTDWETSGFWSPRGLVTEAPVFSKLPRLPTMLGQARVWRPLPQRPSLASAADGLDPRPLLPPQLPQHAGTGLCG